MKRAIIVKSTALSWLTWGMDEASSIAFQRRSGCRPIVAISSGWRDMWDSGWPLGSEKNGCRRSRSRRTGMLRFQNRIENRWVKVAAAADYEILGEMSGISLVGLAWIKRSVPNRDSNPYASPASHSDSTRGFRSTLDWIAISTAILAIVTFTVLVAISPPAPKGLIWVPLSLWTVSIAISVFYRIGSKSAGSKLLRWAFWLGMLFGPYFFCALYVADVFR